MNNDILPDGTVVTPTPPTADLMALDFGDYVLIEQQRHGAPNEMFLHKVVGRLQSNAWVDTPVHWSMEETLHDAIEEVIRCICCGVSETKVRTYRLADVKPATHMNRPSLSAQAVGECERCKILTHEQRVTDSDVQRAMDAIYEHPDFDIRTTGFLLHTAVRAALESMTRITTPPQPADGGDIWEAYKSWPKDIRAKLSCHDLRRMSGWTPRQNPADWGIDTSAGRPILVYQNCSVIEDEQARYVLGLIAKDVTPQVADGGDRVGELVEAATKYRAAVDLMDDAMQDGVNVHGAVSGLLGATDNLDAALAKFQPAGGES